MNILFFSNRQETIRQRRDLSGQLLPVENELITLSKTRSLYKRSTNTSSGNSDIFPLVIPDKTDQTAKMPTEDKISKMDPTNTYYTYVYKEVNASVFSLTLDKLKHYSYYSITVKACREGNDPLTCGTILPYFFFYTFQ